VKATAAEVAKEFQIKRFQDDFLPDQFFVTVENFLLLIFPVFNGSEKIY